MASTEQARRMKRVSILPTAPKAPTTLDSSAVIAERAVLTGVYPINIGPRVVLHPLSRIVSSDGPVTVKEGAIVWEKAVVGAGGTSVTEAADGDVNKAEVERPVTLGRNVVVESYAVVEGTEIGEGTVIEAYAKIGVGAVLGKYCKISTYAEVPPNARVPDFTVIYGQGQQRLDSSTKNNALVLEIKAATHDKHLNNLKSLIPSNLAKWQ